MKQMGFLYDMTTCVGCKSCQMACKDRHDLPPGELIRRVIGYEGGKFPHPWLYYLSLSCNHCVEPLCVKNCPAGALHKETAYGAVLIDDSKCVNCRQCLQSCPYEQIQFFESLGKVTKCDMCVDLVAAGELPACVGACVMRALRFGPLAELESAEAAVKDVKALPNSAISRPSLVLIPSRQAL
jgi:anaerobic dimethyl sulfoxide reductase subunit B (iron-sulfur subunit)